MGLHAVYRSARCDEEVARLRRVLSLRAMVAEGLTQRQIAHDLGISQPAVSQQLRGSSDIDLVHPQVLLRAAAPILTDLAGRHGYSDLAVFGSVARGEARPDSDIDLLVDAPPTASTFDFITFKSLIEAVLGRMVDLVDRGGLDAGIDDDVRQGAVLL